MFVSTTELKNNVFNTYKYLFLITLVNGWKTLLLTLYGGSLLGCDAQP